MSATASALLKPVFIAEKEWSAVDVHGCGTECEQRNGHDMTSRSKRRMSRKCSVAVRRTNPLFPINAASLGRLSACLLNRSVVFSVTASWSRQFALGLVLNGVSRPVRLSVDGAYIVSHFYVFIILEAKMPLNSFVWRPLSAFLSRFSS